MKSIRVLLIVILSAVLALLLAACGSSGSSGGHHKKATPDTAPVADAGPDARIPTSLPYILNGTASTDADSDPLKYSWEFVYRPSGSSASLVNATTATPTFNPDLDGQYVLRLVVNDGVEDSAPDYVSLTARPFGSLDTSFGTDGIVNTSIYDFINTSAYLEYECPRQASHTVTFDSVGNIVASGDGYIARVRPDGTLDPLFNSVGYVSVSNITGGATIDALGNIVTGGGIGNSIYVARYTPDGMLDPSFGTGGKVVNSVTSNSRIAATTIQADGRIVAAGDGGTSASGSSYFIVARYMPNGTLDDTFGTGGIFKSYITDTTLDLGPGGGFHDVAIDALGNIVAAGLDFGWAYNDMAVARFDNSGTLDSSFGSGGIEVASSGDMSTYYDASAYAMVIQPDGKIVVVGPCEQMYASNKAACMMRFNTDGALDDTFGTGGVVRTIASPSATYNDYYGVALGDDGKILAVGYTYDNTDHDIVVARYMPDGTLDTTFNSTGTTPGIWTQYITGNDVATSVAVQSDNKLVVSAVVSGKLYLLRMWY